MLAGGCMFFSVICPVFNGEDFVRDTVDSILSQSWQEWELLLIDDGSTDGSLNVLNQIAEKDPRIHVLHQDNSGPGSARNLGIAKASGDYLVFVDSDDYISSDYLLRLAPLAELNDLVFIDVLQVDESGAKLAEEALSKYKNMDKESLLAAQLTGKIPWGGVRKAVKRDLVQNNGIRYSEIAVGEEALFSFMSLYASKSYSFLEGFVYFYVNREGSQSKVDVDDPWGPTVRVMRDYIEGEGITRLYPALNSFEITAAIVAIDKMSRKYCLREAWKKANHRVHQCEENCGFPYQFDRKCMSLKAKVMLPFLRRNLCIVICLASKVRHMLLEKKNVQSSC